MRDRSRLIFVALALGAATVAAYWGAWKFAFLKVDDPYYVSDEPMVQRGLSGEGFTWAFTTITANNYHPLTWLSHMLDCQIFGVRAGPHHAVNLALHIANAILLLIAFNVTTRAFWPSAFIASVFALHPLHVESVAWIAERKDVLSTFFGLLAILAYVGYARKPTGARYMLVFGLLALGLLAKPMLVTLPFVLMLLDLWPLGRSPFWRNQESADEAMPLLDLLMEKIPLLLLSVVSCLTTVWAQHAGGAVAGLNAYSTLARALNSLMAYGRYLRLTLWPTEMAFYYPFSGNFVMTSLAACAAMLIGGTVLSIRWIRIRPWFAVGFFWYVGTLIPVVGIVQVGGQMMADRYMYIPMIGVSIIVAFAAAEFCQRRPVMRIPVTAIAAASIIAMLLVTQNQARYWKDSITLGRRTIQATGEDNHFAQALLGAGHAEQGDLDAAVRCFEIAEKTLPGRYTKILQDLRIERDRRPASAPAMR